MVEQHISRMEVLMSYMEKFNQLRCKGAIYIKPKVMDHDIPIFVYQYIWKASLKQPYAELLVSRKKTIELRNWNTSFRGKFLVHASKNVDKEDRNP